MPVNTVEILERKPGWARAFRMVVCLLALGFFIEPYLSGDAGGDAFGGHFRYLTRWNFTLNTVIACWALYGDLKGTTSVTSLVASVALPMNTTVLLLYWGLYAIDPALVNAGGIPLHPVKEYYLHLMTSVFAFVECLYLRRPFARLNHSVLGLLGLSGTYLMWVEFAVFPMNDQPCGTQLVDVCGLPYPFLNDMTGPLRFGFYIVALAGISASIPVWVFAKNRLWPKVGPESVAT